jgi:hypothetical protein
MLGVVALSERSWWWNDASPPLAGRSEYAGVPDGMKMPGRHSGREPYQERQRVEVQGERAIAEERV